MESNKTIMGTTRESKRSSFRWFVVSLMFIAILFNYADREIWVRRNIAEKKGSTNSITLIGRYGLFLSRHLRMPLDGTLAH